MIILKLMAADGSELDVLCALARVYLRAVEGDGFILVTWASVAKLDITEGARREV